MDVQGRSMNDLAGSCSPLALVLALSVSGSVGACSGRKPRAATRPGTQPASTSGPARVHQLTWTNYTGTESPEQAIYLFDGEECGRGSEGLASVFRMMESLPRGSVLVIYPDYTDHRPSDPFRIVPYSHRKHELRELVSRRGIAMQHRPSRP